ncbi:MAG: hypothetical protein EHM55_07585 [Acidobacteria bacterium]|nr:MAG: hypothetical protein EHM55_07585 [Acidobacteriota bacterium]
MNTAAAASACGLVALLAVSSADAHKGITSKFTYNADVYPVFLNRCGRCHIDGGVGPMSLVKYEDAFPWAESIRAELLSTSPDPHDFVKAAHRQISARELDIVLDWATGGTPEGDKAATPEPPPFRNEWAAGRPSLTVPMASPYQMPASALEATHEVAMPIPVEMPRTMTQIDLLPGNPAIVRSAALSLRSPDGTARVLGTWVPRQSAAPIALKPPVRIDPGSQIVARIHYKKTWKFEGVRVTDQSSIGLYAAD